MTNFIIKQLSCDLTSNAGLALVGQYFKRIGLARLVDSKFPLRAKGGCGRDGGYPPPPAQIRTCRITAYGSCLRYVTRRTAPQGVGACCGRAERSAWQYG